MRKGGVQQNKKEGNFQSRKSIEESGASPFSDVDINIFSEHCQVKFCLNFFIVGFFWGGIFLPGDFFVAAFFCGGVKGGGWHPPGTHSI